MFCLSGADREGGPEPGAAAAGTDASGLRAARRLRRTRTRWQLQVRRHLPGIQILFISLPSMHGSPEMCFFYPKYICKSWYYPNNNHLSLRWEVCLGLPTYSIFEENASSCSCLFVPRLLARPRKKKCSATKRRLPPSVTSYPCWAKG